MKVCIIIPARLESTRLHHKALADINGKPMILHVIDRANESKLGDVYVAAGNQEIVDVVEAAGEKAILTDPALPSGTDRIEAILDIIDPNEEVNVVIGLQGDSPVIDPLVLKKIIAPFMEDVRIDMTTAIKRMKKADIKNQSKVKAVVSLSTDQGSGRAVYFSRNIVPLKPPYWHHLGIYAFRRKALKKFVTLPQGYLEKNEGLEQLRALENGFWMECVIVASESISVDTQEDLDKVRKLLK